MKKISLIVITTLVSCTTNEMARNYGGEETVELPEHNIFVNATWKGSELWYVTRDNTTGKYYLREKSNYGIWESKIIFQDPTPNKTLSREEVLH